MKSGKGHQEEEDGDEDEFGARKDATTSANNSKDGKNSEKANAIRSKHSVTEQRRRSKINERFQILRELIPHSEQKRDTASFLLEVIDYVLYLQEKVQKYEGSYQAWSSEPTKMMPWRNSHWRNFSGQTQTMKDSSGPSSVPAFPVRFDENNGAVSATMQSGPHNPIEPDQTELPNKTMGMHVPLQTTTPVSIENDSTFTHALLHNGPPSDAQPGPCTDSMNLQDELMIEGGTISISSVYSQGLLNSLTQALQSTGVDLSQASISVQINLGKRAHRGSPEGLSIAKDHGIPIPSNIQTVGTFQDVGNIEDLDQAQKRRKI